jgi:transposase-like protein
VQTCIVHLMRNSLDYAGWKDRKLVAAALKPIYAAANEQQARESLQAFAHGPWGVKYPTIVAAWERAWEHVVPFFIFPLDIRRVIYTTNAIENMNRQLRKIIKRRDQFPSEDSATKLPWLALRNVLSRPSRSVHTLKAAMNQFAILFGERFTAARD